MKFRKRLREEIERSFPRWKNQFVSYKKLKKQLKLINPGPDRDKVHGRWPRYATRRFLEVNDMTLRIGFTRLLDHELKKVTAFYFDKEEDYVIRLEQLKKRAATSANDAEKLEIQKDILNFHGQMVLLLQYSVLNFTGVIKIVKKHNKRTGKTFEFSSMQQSIFSTDLLYNLMKECESLLGPLFLPQDG